MYGLRIIIASFMIGGLIGLFPLLTEGKPVSAVQLADQVVEAKQIQADVTEKQPDSSDGLKEKGETPALLSAKPAGNADQAPANVSLNEQEKGNTSIPVIQLKKPVQVQPVKKVQEVQPKKQTLKPVKPQKKVTVPSQPVQHQEKKTSVPVSKSKAKNQYPPSAGQAPHSTSVPKKAEPKGESGADKASVPVVPVTETIPKPPSTTTPATAEQGKTIPTGQEQPGANLLVP